MVEIRRKFVVTGIILPDKWDENGNVIEIALYTNSEEVFKLERNTLSRALMSFMHKQVKLTGKLKGHPDGITSISAEGFSMWDQNYNDE